jgi:hypothetical protein
MNPVKSLLNTLHCLLSKGLSAFCQHYRNVVILIEHFRDYTQESHRLA